MRPRPAGSRPLIARALMRPASARWPGRSTAAAPPGRTPRTGQRRPGPGVPSRHACATPDLRGGARWSVGPPRGHALGLPAPATAATETTNQSLVRRGQRVGGSCWQVHAVCTHIKGSHHTVGAWGAAACVCTLGAEARGPHRAPLRDSSLGGAEHLPRMPSVKRRTRLCVADAATVRRSCGPAGERSCKLQ